MKKGLAILFAGVKGIVQCVYWIFAIPVAIEHMRGFGGWPHWLTCCAGSLFPLPNEPGIAQMLVPANPIDAFIYYLIVSWMFIPFVIGVTALAGYIGWRIGERRERRKGKHEGNIEESLKGKN